MAVRDELLCKIGDRGYVVDVEGIGWETVKPTRQGIDQAAGAGEASLTNEVVWRRLRDNWTGGAGQEYADLATDEDESSPIRFASSDTIDSWTRRALTVAKPLTRLSPTTLASEVHLVRPWNSLATTGAWLIDGDEIRLYQLEHGSSTLLKTIAAGAQVVDATTFGGQELYVLLSTGAIWKATYNVDTAADTYAVFGAETADMIAAVSTRLLAADDAELFELSGAGAKTTIYTHQDPSFRWDGAVAAPNGIYAWGAIGGTSSIYRMSISDSTGAVDPPVPAAPLPVGEVVRTLIPHLGVLVIGTNLGVRLATVDADGSVSIASLVDEPGAVTALTAKGSDVYLTAAAAPGLWRLRPSRFTDTLVPAFAAETSEVHDPSTPATRTEISDPVDVTTVVLPATATLASKAVTVVAGSDMFAYQAESDGALNLVATEGTIDLGWFTYGIGEDLSFDSLLVECDPLTAGSSWTVTAHIDTPDEDAVVSETLAFVDGATAVTLYPSEDVRARRFRVRLELTADVTTGTTPTVRQVVLRAAPVPFMSDIMLLPLILSDSVRGEDHQQFGLEVLKEFRYLTGLRDTRERVVLQLGDYKATVRVESVEVQSGGLGGGNGLDGYDRDNAFFKGTWKVRLVTVEPDAD